MHPETEVHRIYNELRAIGEALPSNDISLRANFSQLSTKNLILASASYFERRVCECLVEAAVESAVPGFLVQFMQHQTINRKYHTMFDWSATTNVNKFFGLFGTDKARALEGKVKSDDILTKGVRDFVFLNAERNRLVHNNYASFSVDVTFEQVWEKFVSALSFVIWLSTELRYLEPQPSNS